MTSGLPARQIKSWFFQASGIKAVAAHADFSGGNSRIYRIRGANGLVYAGKVYDNSRREERLERINREAAALGLMQSEGFANIPQLVGVDANKRMLVYEYILGNKINQRQITNTESGELSVFIKQLTGLGSVKKSSEIRLAREACLSLAATVQAVRSRRIRLEKVTINNLNLKNFLIKEFDPIFREVIIKSQELFRQAGIREDLDLSKTYQILSPSDFGFHNAIIQNDGKVIFLDFEHFGWDDPAKMTADFLLHPQNRLTLPRKRAFIRAMAEIFAGDRHFPVRLKAIYPLHTLKWCLLLLNEFLPEQLERRRFAKNRRLSDTLVQERQLVKARRLLKKYPYVF